MEEETSFSAPDVVFEEDLRDIADQLADEQWCTETFRNFEKAIDGFLDDDDEEAMWSTVDSIEALLDNAAEAYGQTEVLSHEVTMESTVVHKLLLEGIDEWKGAIEALRDDESDEDPDWSEILAQAEAGNRLLVAVQVYHARLQTELVGSKGL